MAWSGVFTVDNLSFDIYYVSFELHQTVDEVGRPDSPVQGTNIYLEIDDGFVDGDLLLNWATQPNQQYDCVVEEFGTTGRMKRIEIQQAFCVEFIEKFNPGFGLARTGIRTASNDHLQNYITCLRLTAPSLTVADIQLTNF